VGFLLFFFHPQDFCFAKVTTEGRDDTDRGISTTAGARDGTDQRWQGKANPGIGLPRQGWFRDATTRRDVSQGPSWGSLTVEEGCLLRFLVASSTFVSKSNVSSGQANLGNGQHVLRRFFFSSIPTINELMQNQPLAQVMSMKMGKLSGGAADGK
jgi:hypothetical protein